MRSLLARIAFALRHRTLGRKAVTSSKLLVFHRGRTVPLKLRCPHQGGPLAEGYFDGDCLVCPWHGCKFPLSKDGAQETSGDRLHY